MDNLPLVYTGDVLIARGIGKDQGEISKQFSQPKNF